MRYPPTRPTTGRSEWPSVFNNKGFDLSDGKSKLTYLLAATLVFLCVRMLDNTVHEFAHGLAVLAVGGQLAPDPFFITPFGGYTKWLYVPRDYLAFVNIAGTLGSLVFFCTIFIPVFIAARQPWLKWIAYWGIADLVNILLYWLLCPLLSTARRFDPIAFAMHMDIHPVWLIAVAAAFPFAAAVFAVIRATGTLQRSLLIDPDHFHRTCLLSFFTFYVLIAASKYADWLVVNV